MNNIELKSKKINIPGSFAQVNDYLYEKGWTDGLPVIPPTVARVRAMLKTTDRDPQEVIGVVPPSKIKVTIEKTAVNAVMAGCIPEYFPVVLAAMEAVASERFKLPPPGTNPHSPLLIINGPARHKLDINYGYNALGSGYRSNATIGRAIRLTINNVGRIVVRPGLEGVFDHTTLGQPGKFTFCMGENEEANPWEPMHVERGFAATDSTVTAFHGTSLLNILDMVSKTAKNLLVTIAGSMTPLGTNNISHYATEPVVILCPEHAYILCRDGYSKKDVKQYLYEHARVPLASFSEDVVRFLKEIKRPIIDGAVHIVNRPEDIAIVVAGELGPHSAFVTTHGRGPHSVTKKIVFKNQSRGVTR